MGRKRRGNRSPIAADAERCDTHQGAASTGQGLGSKSHLGEATERGRAQRTVV